MKPTVLITGASRGIGYSIAKCFHAAGYLVFACARHESSGLKELSDLGCITTLTDVSDESAVKSLFETISRQTDHLDALINNAGISYRGLLQDMTAGEWDRIMASNLKSAFLCARAALPAMIQHRQGVIVNISSMWGEAGASCEVAYSASKGGLNAFTKALAREVAPSGIRVNAIACGAIDTDMNRFLSAEERSSLEESIGLGRFGLPREVADLALYLCSSGSSYLTGEVIALDGAF